MISFENTDQILQLAWDGLCDVENIHNERGGNAKQAGDASLHQALTVSRPPTFLCSNRFPPSAQSGHVTSPDQDSVTLHDSTAGQDVIPL